MVSLWWVAMGRFCCRAGARPEFSIIFSPVWLRRYERPHACARPAQKAFYSVPLSPICGPGACPTLHGHADPARACRRAAVRPRTGPLFTMQTFDEHDAAKIQRTALECEAIAADLERLKIMIADASDRLLASFNVVGALAKLPARSEEDQRRLAGAVASAVTA